MWYLIPIIFIIGYIFYRYKHTTYETIFIDDEYKNDIEKNLDMDMDQLYYNHYIYHDKICNFIYENNTKNLPNIYRRRGRAGSPIKNEK
jgi:hypothetical protein